ncbi:MAG: SHOCT domain-containing protein [Anaerovoracaceae bacterium]
MESIITTIDPATLIEKFGDNKVEAVKYVSKTNNLKLKEAKKIVDGIYTECGGSLALVWQPTKTIGTVFQIDDNNKKWAPTAGIFKPRVLGIYSYSDILEYEMIEDGDSITKGGLGSALVGGVLLGGVGAVVGGVTGGKKTKKIVNSLSIKVTTKDIDNPTVYINFIAAKTKTSSITYKTAFDCAQETLSILAQIVSQNESTQEETSAVSNASAADEIRKYKELMDEDIISKEEFEAKKKELLGL